MKLSKTLATIICLALAPIFAVAQSNISAALVGPAFDFGDRENAALYQIKPDESGRFILQPGIRLGAELYANDITSLKFAQTVKMDCMKKAAFSTQIMLRFRLFKIYKHSMSIGFGPVGFYRQTWENIEGYTDDGYKNGSIQSKIVWLSAELEYNYYLSKKNDISFAIIHADPKAMGFAIGIKHWFSRKSSHCNTCPSFH